MKKINLHIEIVSSNIVALSSMSHKSRLDALYVLSQYYTNVSVTMINNIEDLYSLVSKSPDLVILGMKYIPKNKYDVRDQDRIWISDFLDSYGINHTGSTHDAHRLELNKDLAKQQIMDSGLASARYALIKQNQTIDPQQIDLNYPLFVKPNNLGGGVGIDNNSLVYDLGQLQTKTDSISVNYHTDSLVEEYLPGREFSVAILGNYGNPLSLMPIELVASANATGEKLLSHEVKLANEEQVSLVDEGPLKDQLVELAADVYASLGARDYARIDIRLDENGTPNFLEANLIPSLIDGYGSFPKACLLNIGMDYETMFTHIVNLALQRSSINELVYT